MPPLIPPITDWFVPRRRIITMFREPKGEADTAREATEDYVPAPQFPDPESWQTGTVEAEPAVAVPCRVINLGKAREATCSMVVGGRELPRVSFPAWVLRRKGLTAGSRFIWRMPASGDVCLVDISTDVPADPSIMTPQDLERLEVLYLEMKKSHDEDGPWPVYTGDGK
jgi:hypothetical protein